MRDIVFFAIGASVVGTIFCVSTLELFFTIRRRKVHEELMNKVKEMRAQVNETINKMVLEDEAKIEVADNKATEAEATLEAERARLEAEYQEKVKDIDAISKKSMASAKAKAKKMQDQAELKAEEYLADRKKEVEKELMELVLSISRKVIPKGISYEAHRELVMKALRDIREEK